MSSVTASSVTALNWLNDTGRDDDAGCTRLPLARPEFYAEMNRERLRADRNSSGFSMLTIAFRRAATTRALLDVAADVIAGRLRDTDEYGWIKDRTLSIIMPDTPVEGAIKLADELQRRLTKSHMAPKLMVYTYPSVGAKPREANESDLESSNAVSPARVSIQPMHQFFARPLPLLKRALDILASATALVLVSPIMLLTAIAVKLTSPGPIIYAQQRDGLGGRHFRIYKFRTMVVNADALKKELLHKSEQDGPAFKLKNDPRVTSIGRILRRTCIDELPQLFNVLKGDMSLVGPRPMCSKEAAQCNQWERRRLDVTPGVTCIWQVYGGTKVTFTEWMRMDLRYVAGRSLWKDLRLILMTIPSVIRRDGVY